MRVIAGQLGGRRLRAPSGNVTRPTSDRVREALFAMLGDVQEARVLDLFAGSGGLGIEALSRGAEHATFVERHIGAVKVLQANLEGLGLGRERARVCRSDALDGLRSAREHKETYDLLFIDPPYAQARDLESKLPVLLAPLLESAARVVVESDRRVPLQLSGELERERRYGDTSIRIYRHP